MLRGSHQRRAIAVDVIQLRRWWPARTDDIVLRGVFDAMRVLRYPPVIRQSARNEPMAVISMEGLYDLHIHTGPAPFKRVGDTIDIGRWCAQAGMAGIVTKAHLENSFTKAYHANKELGPEFPNFKVYAAICLNRGVGGINPAAVEVALDQGAKIVWFPTFDAAFHAEQFGGAGNYGSKGTKIEFKGNRQRGGYRATDANGKLTAESKEVVDIIADYEGVLATGHISEREIRALVEYALSKKLKRIVITHPDGKVPSLDEPAMIELAKAGCFMEFVAAHCYAFAPNVGPRWRRTPGTGPMKAEELRDLVQAIGFNRCILSSDSGHVLFPKPPETLRSLLQILHERGISEEAIQQMCRHNPAFLMGVTAKLENAKSNGAKSHKKPARPPQPEPARRLVFPGGG
jgi:hypothetical protein